MNKKKYRGGLKVLLLLLFIMLLSFCSISYANITQDYVDYAIDLFANNFTAQSYLDIQSTMRNYFANFTQNDKEYILNIINNYLTSNNISNLNNYNCIFIARFNQFASNGSPWRMDVYFCNNSFPNGSENLGFLLLGDDSIEVQNINLTDRIYHIRFELNNLSTNTFFTWYPNSSNLPSCFCRPYSYPNNDYSVVKCYNVACYGIPAIYAYTPLNNSSSSSIVPCILEDCLGNYNIVDPEEPSGDISGDFPIIPSGESGTGSIDYTNQLNNIQNQISGDTQKVIENQNQNTEQIVNAVNNANQNYWGSSGDLDEEDQEDLIRDSINSIVSDLSGEFNQNAVFSELETAEGIFLDFFRNQEDESFYDLIISWDNIQPIFTMFGGSVTVSNQVLISGDSINLSALCRNNSTLASIQQYIRIIFNFSVLISLIWQIYNLILSTLGIDNPYLYEDSSVNDVVNPDTGEFHSYIKIRRRIFKKWW